MNTNAEAVGSAIQYVTKIVAEPAVNPSVEVFYGIVATNTALKEFELDNLIICQHPGFGDSSSSENVREMPE